MDPAHQVIFHAKVGKGGISSDTMCFLWHIVVENDNAHRKAQNVLQRLCYGIHKITNMSNLRPQDLEL